MLIKKNNPKSSSMSRSHRASSCRTSNGKWMANLSWIVERARARKRWNAWGKRKTQDTNFLSTSLWICERGFIAHLSRTWLPLSIMSAADEGGLSGRPVLHFHFHNLRIWVTVLIVCNYYSICEARLSCRVESANLIKFEFWNELLVATFQFQILWVQRTQPNCWPTSWARKSAD